MLKADNGCRRDPLPYTTLRGLAARRRAAAGAADADMLPAWRKSSPRQNRDL